MTLAHSVLVLSILILVSFAFGARWFQANRKALKLNLAAWIAGFWGLAIALLLLDVIFSYNPDQQIPALLSGLTGACIGWLIGIWITPMGNTESTKFSRYWTAIGVGSGFTLKWAMDHIFAPQQRVWFVSHWFITTIFAVSLLTTVVTVYNGRAYDNALSIHVRKKPGTTTEVDTAPLTLTTGQEITLYTEVEGVSDALCRWEVFPPELGVMQDTGFFKAADSVTTGRITALNLEDPTLSNFINVTVIAAAAPASSDTNSKEKHIAPETSAPPSQTNS